MCNKSVKVDHWINVEHQKITILVTKGKFEVRKGFHWDLHKLILIIGEDNFADCNFLNSDNSHCSRYFSQR